VRRGAAAFSSAARPGPGRAPAEAGEPGCLTAKPPRPAAAPGALVA